MLEEIIHWVDFAGWYFDRLGDPVSVSAAGAVRGEWSAAMDRSDTPTASLRLLDGLTGEERFDIGPVTDVALEHPSGEVFELELMIRRFVAGLASGTPVVSGEEGRRAVALCLAAEEAMRVGREVAIKL